MRNVLATVALLFSGSVFAAPVPMLNCTVPVTSGTPQVQLAMAVQSDTSADFVIVSLNDKGTASRMFTQQDKGSVAKGLAEGSFFALLMEDSFAQDVGVLRNAGLLVISRGDTGAYTGLLSAKSAIYPLACTINK